MSNETYKLSESVDILKKTFITLSDFYILLGKKSESNRQLYLTIKAQIKNDLTEMGLYLPDSRHIPLGRTLEILKHYGITRESILENAKHFN